MPIREGGAKLWFDTKEEQDEFDDKMIASVMVQSTDYESSNFTPIFFRKREESHLSLTDKSGKDIKNFLNLRQSYANDLIGKRDHTFWRDIVFFKYGLTYGVGYLLLRQLPIRNLYARAWIMFAAFSYMLDTAPLWIGKGGIKLANDPFNDKDIKNYGIYEDLLYRTPPSLNNKLPEHRLWKMNQPGHLVVPDGRYPTTAIKALFKPKQHLVPWDGTFNMPLEALASPKHKDAKWIDFRYM